MSGPAQVPVPASPFVGRGAELAGVRAAFEAERLVSLVGPGGSGKTRLAIEVARSFDLAVCGFVELAGRTATEALPEVVLAACGIRDDPERDSLDRLQERLAGAQAVLVLDNCEQLAGPVAELVSGLLRRGGGLRVLVTSRVRLGVTGEIVLSVGGLGTGDPGFEGDLDSDSPDRSGEAVALFLDRARRVQPALPDSAGTRSAAARISRLVDGLPLLVELAAAHARSLSLTDIECGLADRVRFLQGARTDGPEHHRSLQACIEWSMQLVGDRARAALSALSVVGGRFTLGAALAVTGDDVAVIETLVEQSLLQFDPVDGRYVLLDSVRAYAAHLLAASDASERVQRRLLEWAADLADTVREGLGRAERTALDTVERDEAGLRSALSLAAESGRDLAIAGDVVADLAFGWSLRGRCAEGRDRARRIHGQLATPGARLGWATAFLTAYAGDMEVGVGLAMAAAEQAEIEGDPATRGRALTLVGMVQMFVDPAGAEEVLTGAVALADEADDDWCRVESLQMLAYSFLLRSEFDAALASADRAGPALARLGHDQLSAWDAAIRADAAVQAGRVADAEAHGRTGLALARTVREPVSAGGALLPLVRALVHQDRGVEAAALVEEVRPFFLAHPGVGTTDMLVLAALIPACWADPAAAHEQAARAHTAATAGGLPLLVGETGALLAISALARGENARAAVIADEAAVVAGSVGNREIRGMAALTACAADRSAPDAFDRAHRALADAAAGALSPLVADGLDLVAGLHLDTNRTVLAARLHAASDRLRDTLGVRRSPLAVQFRPGDERRVREALPADQLAAARADGARLDLRQAAAYATRSRGRRARPRTGWSSLTPTECEVVGLVAQGLGNQAIGDRLLIAPGTVRTHLRSIFGKLGVTSRAELAARAASRDG